MSSNYLRSQALPQSFSGADTKVYAYFPFITEVVILPSVHTLSVSVHEAKGMARALGFRGIKGVARGVRTIAGSLILTVINENPLLPLMNLVSDNGLLSPGWSLDRESTGTGTVLNNRSFHNKIAPLLPPFNIILQCLTENARTQLPNKAEGAGYLLRGVEFIDEGMVVSVNDVVTEITYSFIAIDYKPISKQEFRDDRIMDDSINNLMHENNEILHNRLFEEKAETLRDWAFNYL